MAPQGKNTGRGLHGQVSGVQKMKFDVRCGCVAPRAAVGGVRAVQVANRPPAAPLTDLLFVLACCGPAVVGGARVMRVANTLQTTRLRYLRNSGVLLGTPPQSCFPFALSHTKLKLY